MSVMSTLERSFCKSPPWNLIARRVVLPWALQRELLSGDVLEVGAGSGAMAAGLLRSHPIRRLTVTDLDPKMVDRAGRLLDRYGRRAGVEVADATSLPYADGTFDVAVSFLMLHHVGRWEEALRELVRVVRPGGKLLVYDLLESRLWRLAHGISRSDGIRPITIAELERTLGGLPVAQADLRGRRRFWFRLRVEVTDDSGLAGAAVDPAGRGAQRGD